MNRSPRPLNTASPVGALHGAAAMLERQAAELRHWAVAAAAATSAADDRSARDALARGNVALAEALNRGRYLHGLVTANTRYVGRADPSPEHFNRKD